MNPKHSPALATVPAKETKSKKQEEHEFLYKALQDLKSVNDKLHNAMNALNKVNGKF